MKSLILKTAFKLVLKFLLSNAHWDISQVELNLANSFLSDLLEPYQVDLLARFIYDFCYEPVDASFSNNNLPIL